MGNIHRILISLLATVSLVTVSTSLMADTPKMGIVVMHGKGGSPSRLVGVLAKKLKKSGYEVANIEMPWSGSREYDVDTGEAQAEVEKALTELRAAGAQKVFVAGHSQGGVFALHLAGRLKIDGVIPIAPGGNVGSNKFRNKLGKSVNRARELVAQGKGDKKTNLKDFEGSKGVFSVRTTPDIYLTWFDPDGAMNSRRAAAAVSPQVPILWIVAEKDYPGLVRSNIPLFDEFPANPNTELYRSASDHKGAPRASVDEIIRWTTKVATSK